jgi:two-component system, cell cycle sensor histidine kinase and response regulator CckA
MFSENHSHFNGLTLVPSENSSKNSVETILLVDDEECVREIISEVLSENGYYVLEAKNGAEGLSLYLKHQAKIKLVLLDLLMPVMNGLDCAKEILKINPAAKVLIGSGFIDESYKQKLAEMPAVEVMSKPYRNTNLLTAIEKIIGK